MFRRRSLALHSALSLASLAALPAPASAQGATFQGISPGGYQAVDISDDGDEVVGVLGDNGFRWSAATGFEALPGGAAWAVTPDGTVISGTALNGGGDNEAGRWTPGGGWVALGNYGGSPGCDAFISNFDDMTPDGQWAAGMSWQGCETSALRWNATTGFELLPKQIVTSSARAYCMSDDGQTCAGWEEAANGQRRGAVWLPNGSEIFPLVSPTNAIGAGEIYSMSSDGSVMCGISGSQAFRRTAAGGVELLPKLSGNNGSHTALDISEDGSVVVGVASNFPSLTAWIWTPAGGTQTMLAWLQAQGVTGLTAGLLRNATGVSNDGLAICGWGTAGAWYVEVLPETPWTDLGGGTNGVAGPPLLTMGGTLLTGELVTLDLSLAAPSALALLFGSISSTPTPFLGGTLHAWPAVAQVFVFTDALGEIHASVTFAGAPSGTQLWFQAGITDASVPVYGASLSNGVVGLVP